MGDNTIPDVMKVPRFLGKGKIDFIKKPVPKPGPAQLLIHIKANALCGSERGQFFNGTDVTPGHESSGIVVAAGRNTHTPTGTPGVIYLIDFCGQCRNCKLGFTNQCLSIRSFMGFDKDGGYGMYELVNENIFFSINKDIDLVEGLLLLDIMGTGGHAIKRGQLVHPDIQSLIVTGAGPIGLGVVAMAKIMLGKDVPVFISDVIPYRLTLAECLGAVPINIKEKGLEEGIRSYGLEVVDIAIDASGKGTARQACMDILAKRGALVCIGHGEGLHLEVSSDLIGPERAVLGSEYFCYDELSENKEHLCIHRSYLSQIITHRYSVDNIQHAFEVFFKGETGKVVIEQ